MKKTSLQQLTLCGLLTALICVLTLFPRIALPSGYVHLGDGLILLAITGTGLLGIPAAALGSMLADLLAFPAYAPATFCIKGLMALAAWGLMGKSAPWWRRLLAYIVAESIMAAGYFAFELCFFPSYALLDLPGNIIQGVFGVIVALAGQRTLSRLRRVIPGK